MNTEAATAGVLPAVHTARLARLAVLSAAAGLLLVVSGFVVRAGGAGLACATWPDCAGAVAQTGGAALDVTHRTLTVISGALLILTALFAWLWRAPLRARIYALTGVALAGAQVLIGAVLVWAALPPLDRTLHSVMGVATLLCAVMTAVALAPARPAAEAGPIRQTISAYVALTKPRVISLLLFTTLAGMFITPRGAPPWYLVVWTMIGGYLMAGAANAVNMWYDSDIDDKMGRTKLRPIPSGRVTPRRALIFGFVLFALSMAIFVLFVNVAAAALAFAGFIYYTVIYTHWLKRSTWQNIVIGGGAGAIPPLIGWAAGSGWLSWQAMMLFFIVFYWTPPHFWALALMKRKDYAAAGVPMLPVVAGEEETSRQIVIYSAGMFALTIVLVPLGMMGLIYLAGAVVLGALFMHYAWRAMRERTPKRIWGLYGYSLLYLALLFAVMVVDRMVSL